MASFTANAAYTAPKTSATQSGAADVPRSVGYNTSPVALYAMTQVDSANVRFYWTSLTPNAVQAPTVGVTLPWVGVSAVQGRIR